MKIEAGLLANKISQRAMRENNRGEKGEYGEEIGREKVECGEGNPTR
jgi:hypothetical protein